MLDIYIKGGCTRFLLLVSNSMRSEKLTKATTKTHRLVPSWLHKRRLFISKEISFPKCGVSSYLFFLIKEMCNIHSYILSCSGISGKIIHKEPVLNYSYITKVQVFHSIIKNLEQSHNVAVTHSFQTPVYKLVYPVDSYADAWGKMLSSTIWNGSKNVSLAASCQRSVSQS